MEIDDTFKNKSSATFGEWNHTFKREKENVPMCQNRAFICCPIYYSLSKISISLTFSSLVSCIRHAVEELWKFCATQGVSWVATLTKSLPRLGAKLARISVVSAFEHYCNVIASLKKERGNSRQKQRTLEGNAPSFSNDVAWTGQGLSLVV